MVNASAAAGRCGSSQVGLELWSCAVGAASCGTWCELGLCACCSAELRPHAKGSQQHSPGRADGQLERNGAWQLCAAGGSLRYSAHLWSQCTVQECLLCGQGWGGRRHGNEKVFLLFPVKQFVKMRNILGGFAELFLQVTSVVCCVIKREGTR